MPCTTRRTAFLVLLSARPSSLDSLQAAVASAKSGDHVVLAGGAYTVKSAITALTIAGPKLARDEHGVSRPSGDLAAGGCSQAPGICLPTSIASPNPRSAPPRRATTAGH